MYCLRKSGKIRMTVSRVMVRESKFASAVHMRWCERRLAFLVVDVSHDSCSLMRPVNAARRRRLSFLPRDAMHPRY